MVWHRGKTKISRLLGNSPAKMRPTHESTCCLPYDIVETVIPFLTYDLDALKACSLTCRSWYAIAVPHIHHTFLFKEARSGIPYGKLKPLSKLHELGLMPLIRELRVRQYVMPNDWFTPQAFSPSDLRYFSAFTSVHTLRIHNLDIDRFIPSIERYFQQFSQTLRSITLYNPICTGSQKPSYFLSLFPNLDNVEIQLFYPLDEPSHSVEFVPFSAPALRGQLKLYDFWPVETLTHLIAVCGGLRFRHMDLRKVGRCAPVLFKACAKTLETLRLYVPDNPGQYIILLGSPADQN